MQPCYLVSRLFEHLLVSSGPCWVKEQQSLVLGCWWTIACSLHGLAGVCGVQAAQVVEGLGVTSDKEAAMDQIKALYTVFDKCDCTMVEVRLGLSRVYLFCLAPALRPALLCLAGRPGRLIGWWLASAKVVHHNLADPPCM